MAAAGGWGQQDGEGALPDFLGARPLCPGHTGLPKGLAEATATAMRVNVSGRKSNTKTLMASGLGQPCCWGHGGGVLSTWTSLHC